MTPSGSIPRELTRMRRPAAVAATVGIVWLLIAMMFSGLKENCFRAYLTAWLLFLGISLGSMAIIMLGHLVPGAWSLMIRRLGEAAAVNLIVCAFLFIPILFGLSYLFPWARPDLVRADPILLHRAQYLNPTAFFIRAVVYFALWIAMAMALRRESLEYDRTSDLARLRRAQRISAFGLVAYFVTMSLASVDWILSRDAHWYSSIIGFVVVVGQATSGMAFMVWLLMRIINRDPIAPVIERRHLNDLGNLLLTLVILWAYLSFAQLLVIWMGNMKDDVGWYVERGLGLYANGWRWLGLFLVVFHFLVPFFILLSRDNKRRASLLGAVAIWLLLMRFLDNVWMVIPTREQKLTVMLIPAVLAVGGVWIAVYVRLLEHAPLLAIGLPLAADGHGANGASHAAPAS